MRLGKLGNRCKNRLLVQEHSILTLINYYIGTNPDIKSFEWLDVCCGDGSFFKYFEESLKQNISKIQYYGYDIANDSLRICKVNSVSFGINVTTNTGELNRILEYYPDDRFKMVSFINALHEIEFKDLCGFLLDMIFLCEDNGNIFIFDMEKPPMTPSNDRRENETGALFLEDYEIEELLRCLLRNFNPDNIIVQKNQFSTTSAYQIILNKAYLNDFKNIYNSKKSEIIQESDEVLIKILEKKIQKINNVIWEMGNLDLFSERSAEYNEIISDLEFYLYQHWSCSRELLILRDKYGSK